MQENKTLPVLIIQEEDLLKVEEYRLTDGYDSHSLRSYYYFRDKVPLIRQAKEEDKTYLLNGKYLLGTDTVSYQGKTLTVEELYNDYLCSNR